MNYKKTHIRNICTGSFLGILLLILCKNIAVSEFIYSISSGYAIERYSKSLTAPLGHYIYKKNNDLYFSSIENLFNSYGNNNKEDAPDEVSSKFINLLSVPLPVSEEYTNLFALDNDKKKIYFDIFSSMNFVTFINSIPFDFNIQYEFSRKFRIGFGLLFEINFLKKFNIDRDKPNQKNLEYVASKFLDKLDLLKSLDGSLDTAINNAHALASMDLFKNFLKSFSKTQISIIKKIIEKIEPKSIAQKSSIRKLVKEISQIEKDCPSDQDSELKDFYPRNKVIFSISPYIIFGFKIFETDDFAGLFEFQWSPSITRFAFATKLVQIETSAIPFTMIGIPTLGFSLEQHISEYFRLFYKISARSMENYELDISAPSLPLKYTTSWRFGFEIGAKFTTPEFERCTIDKCAIVVKHRHNSIKMRGSNMFTGTDTYGNKMFKKAQPAQ